MNIWNLQNKNNKTLEFTSVNQKYKTEYETIQNKTKYENFIFDRIL